MLVEKHSLRFWTVYLLAIVPPTVVTEATTLAYNIVSYLLNGASELMRISRDYDSLKNCANNMKTKKIGW